MEIEKIITLINAVSQSNINSFSIEEDHFKLSMNKVDQSIQVVQKPMVQLPTVEVPKKETISQSVVEETKENNQPSKDINVVEIKSPIVGTFYSSSGPDADDFVKVGDIVKKGQVVCIIEAMKLLNEIENDYDGEIVDILVKNEQMVEYNQPLFRVRLG